MFQSRGTGPKTLQVSSFAVSLLGARSLRACPLRIALVLALARSILAGAEQLRAHHSGV